MPNWRANMSGSTHIVKKSAGVYECVGLGLVICLVGENPKDTTMIRKGSATGDIVHTAADLASAVTYIQELGHVKKPDAVQSEVQESVKKGVTVKRKVTNLAKEKL